MYVILPLKIDDGNVAVVKLFTSQQVLDSVQKRVLSYYSKC
jgi:hypothetical protein